MANQKGYTRSHPILQVVYDLGNVIRELDRLQLGDPNNSISPIKHKLMETQEELRRVGREAQHAPKEGA